MANFTCPTCLKDYKQKAHYTTHINKLNKCKPSSTVQALLQVAPLPEPVQVNKAFRDVSLKMNDEIPKKERQDKGIFFTPRKARDLAFEKLKEFGLTEPQTVLEPACGTGEFLEDVALHYPNASVTGVEKDSRLCNVIKAQKNLQTLNEDFILYKGPQVDLIIGNPPYFVIEDKNINCMTGRSNIYVLFLYKCLSEHLKPNGFLAFVLPTSLFNCTYYEPMRNYISHYCTIKFLQELDVSYHETSQDTMLIIIQNCPDPEGAYMFNRNGCHFISPMYKALRELVKDTVTLKDLGFTVKTGDVVWNQYKNQLCLEEPEATIVIYSTNIKDGTLVFNNITDKKGEKKQYIKQGEKQKKSEAGDNLERVFTRDPVEGPAIVVNRGYGNVYTLSYAKVDLPKFYAENHVNMILPSNEAAKDKIPDVLKSLGSNRTKKFIQWFCGKGAMSKTEIESVLPIFS